MPFNLTRRYREHRAFGKYTHGKTVLSQSHRMTHEGFMFHASGKQTGIANAGTAVFLMSVPAGCYPHIQRVGINTDRGDIDLLMRENVVTSADGAAIPVLNVNRNSAIVPCAIATGAPTITTPGDLFHTIYVPPTGAGVGSAIGVMGIEQGEEWVLKEDTKYSFTITNNSGATIDLSYEFVWYEIGYDDLPHV